MFNDSNNGGASVADIAALLGNGGNGWANMFGGDGIWALIILFAIFGWGNGGWGFGNQGAGGGAQAGFYATQADLQRGFDQALMSQKIDNLGAQLEHGIKDPGYMVSNSFAQAALERATNQAALMAQINSNATANMQGVNDLQLAILQNGNQNAANVAQIRYDMATNDCAVKNAITQATQQIMLNDNNNYRALHDEMIADKMAAKDAEISMLRDRNNSLELAASQSAQNNYLINQLRPAAVPAYQVPNPYYGYGYSCNNCNM